MFLEYFGNLNETMERMEQCQEVHAKELEKILQNQEKQEKYIDTLGDLYENLSELLTAFNQQYTSQMANIETQLESLWVNIIPPPPFDASNAPPRPPYRVPPY